MKITMAAVKIEFESYEEACCYIALYAGVGTGSVAYQELTKYVPGYMDTPDAYDTEALKVAIRLVAERNHVALPEAVSPVAPEPTWTSKSGRTMRLKDMPTPYLRNVEMFAARSATYGNGYDGGPGSGLVKAIRAELERRDD